VKVGVTVAEAGRGEAEVAEVAGGVRVSSEGEEVGVPVAVARSREEARLR